MLMRNAAVFVFAVVVIVIAGHCLVFACCAIQASAWVMTDEQLVHCDQDKPNVVVSLCLSVCLSSSSTRGNANYNHNNNSNNKNRTWQSSPREKTYFIYYKSTRAFFFKLITFSCKLLFFFWFSFGFVIGVRNKSARSITRLYPYQMGYPFFFFFFFFLKSLVYSSPLALKQFFMFVHMSTILILILVVVFLHC